MVKNKKSKERIDKREEKHRRIASAIANLEIGAVVTPTDLARSLASTHPDTLKDFLDSYDSLRQINFKVLRDNDGIIKAVIKTDDNSSTKDLDIKEELSKINDKLDELIKKG